MTLATAVWKSTVEQRADKRDLIDKIAGEDPPTSTKDCRADRPWAELLRIFLESEYSTENIDFLDAVDAFKASGAPTPEELYDRFVKIGAEVEVNVSFFMKNEIQAALESPDPTVVRDKIDAAYEEVTTLVDSDSYKRFKKEIPEKARPAWQPDEEVQTKAYVSVPRAAAARPPDSALVDRVNEQVLKDLGVNKSVTFFQFGDLMIVDAGKGGEQHGLEWIRDQEGVAMGTITMVKKGGAFGPGSVRAEGVVDRHKFEAAIAKVSKKAITYA